MTAWWTDNHARLALEREAIAVLQSSADWLENVQWTFDDSVRMQVVFDIRMNHGVFNLLLTYHSTFPYSAPGVAPLDPSKLSDHQYGNGDLCLEIRPDNWREEFTGADMIESAFNLLDKEKPDPEGVVTPAPSAHNVPDTILLRNAICRFYLSDSQFKILKDQARNFSTATVWIQWCGESFVVAHLFEVKQDDWCWRDHKLPCALGQHSSTLDAVILKSDKSAAAFANATKTEQLIEYLGVAPSEDQDDFSCLVVPADGNPILFRKVAGFDDLIRYRTILVSDEAIQRSRTALDDLAGLRIGVVGLGSLGSKVAVSLARSGVRRFDLIDDDLLHAGNLERHDADWRDIGLHKVDVAKRRIELIAAHAIVTARRVSIGAQVSATEAASVNGALSECDLIVDATANPAVLNHLAAIVLSTNKTLVWGGVYAGGIGGYIARSRPAKDADPLVIRQAMNDFFETVDTPPPAPSADGYDAQDDAAVIIASDPGVSVLAGHVAAFALDSLLQSEPSIYDDPVYLIGFERAWLFEAPFHTQPISVNAPHRTDCQAQQHDERQSAFVEELLKKKLDEIARRQQDA